MASRNVGIFGTRTRSNTLLVISMLGETHASEIARILEISLSQAQIAINSLEAAGILIGADEGNARRVRLNPRLTVAPELRALLEKMGLQDEPLQQKLAQIRRRPRRSGKPL